VPAASSLSFCRTGKRVNRLDHRRRSPVAYHLLTWSGNGASNFSWAKAIFRVDLVVDQNRPGPARSHTAPTAPHSPGHTQQRDKHQGPVFD
jgi:hypothetical protein